MVNALKNRVIEIQSLREAYEKKINEIKAEERYSDAFKSQLILEEKTAFEDEMNRLQADLNELMNGAVSELIEKEPIFDFSDQRLIGAINLIKSSEKRLPDKVINDIVDTYKNSREAMQILKGCFEQGNKYLDYAIKANVYASKPTKAEELQALSDTVYYECRTGFSPDTFRKIMSLEGSAGNE